MLCSCRGTRHGQHVRNRRETMPTVRQATGVPSDGSGQFEWRRAAKPANAQVAIDAGIHYPSFIPTEEEP